MASRNRSTGRTAYIVGVATIVVILVGTAGLTALNYFGFFKGFGPIAPGQTTTAAPIPLNVGYTANNLWSGAGAAFKSDIINPSNLQVPLENQLTATSAGVFTSAKFYTPGTTLFLHFNLAAYYDNTATVSVPSVVTNPGTSTQQYYLGNFALTPQSSATQLAFQLVDPSGAVDSSTTSVATGGSAGTWAATSKVNTFTVAARVTTAQKSYAFPMPYLTSSFKLINLQGTIWVGVNSTAISISALQGQGYALISTQPTSWTVVYKQLPEIDSPTNAAFGSYSQSTTIDTSAIAANKHLALWVWIGDLQNAADNAQGVADATPVAYGAFGAIGPAVIGITYTAPTTQNQAY